jgi:hypothetical protein
MQTISILDNHSCLPLERLGGAPVCSGAGHTGQFGQSDISELDKHVTGQQCMPIPSMLEPDK